MTRFDRWWRSARPKWWNGPPPASPPRIEPTIRAPMKISMAALAQFGSAAAAPKLSPWEVPTYAPGVVPKLAEDSGALCGPVTGATGWATGYHGLFSEGIGFYGYPYLAELTQRAEYRVASEVIAEEMTRKWIELSATGKDDKSDKIAALTAAMERYRLREAFRNATELDGFFGLSFIKIDLGEDSDQELATPLMISSAKIAKGSLNAFRVVDPTWTAPNRYNSSDPLDPTFYRPQTWFVMGKQVHSTRLLTFVSRPVPDILKPAYNFGGLSLSQMMKPYVDNWLRTRQSVSDLLNSFTVFVLETNMMALLSGATDAAGQLDNRMAVFTAIRNNRGLMAIDKDQEALTNISAPLGTLDHLQAQAQEHMAAVARIPLVKLLGITPSGLNASSDGEIRTFYDSMHGRQERLFGDPLKTALDVLQLNEFGEIDPEISYKFVPLWQLDDAGRAAVQKTQADTDAVLSETGAIGPEDIRRRVTADPDSAYHGLEGDAPGVPDGGEEFADLNDPSGRIANRGAEGAESGANSGV